MPRRDGQAAAPAAQAAAAARQRRAVRTRLRRGYQEMGPLNLALAEEGLLFEDGSAGPGEKVGPP